MEKVNKEQNAGIPVVDLGSPNASQELLAASVVHGFIFVKQETSGLSQTAVDDMFSISRDFFAAPDDVKAEATINSKTSGKNHGWLAMQKETLDPSKQKKGDFKEAFNIGEFINDAPQQPFPGPIQNHTTEVGTFMKECHGLCLRLLSLLAQGLNISEAQGGQHWFSERHDVSHGASGSILRLLHYPSLPASTALNPEEDIRAGAHSDYGSVTLLFRLPGQPGLEVLTPSGAWAPVPVNPEPAQDSNVLPILVNIGDVLSFWTNGLLRSTVHRVIFPAPGEGPTGGADRYSIAYFCHPLDDAQLVGIPSSVIEDYRKSKGIYNQPDAGIITARDHLNSRLAATYAVG